MMAYLIVKHETSAMQDMQAMQVPYSGGGVGAVGAGGVCTMTRPTFHLFLAASSRLACCC